MEVEIFKTLDFSLFNYNYFDYFTIILKFLKEEVLIKYDQNLIEKFQTVCLYFFKLILFDFENFNKKNFPLVSSAVFMLAFKVLQEIEPEIDIEKIVIFFFFI